MNIKETISDLEVMLFSLHPSAKGLYEAIETIKGFNTPNEAGFILKVPHHASKAKYDPKTNMRSKTLFALRELNRFVKNKEIAQYLHQQEPEISVKDFITALSGPIFYLKKEERIHKITIGTGNNNVYWGSLRWVNEDGTVKDEHKYIEEPKQEEIEI